MSTVSILNVGHGDTTLSFDPGSPADMEHAKRTVQDMLRRGYAIMVQVGEEDGEPIYRRARSFDPETCEYVIVGVPADDAPSAKAAKAKKPREKRVKATEAPASAIAPSAGG